MPRPATRDSRHEGIAAASEDRTVEHGVFAVEREAHVRGSIGCHQAGDIFSDRRPMLEAVARSAANNPHVSVFGMAIDEEVAGRGVLVLTHAAFDERGVRQAGESPPQPRPGGFDTLAIDRPISSIGIESGAMSVDADLDAATLYIGDSVNAGREVDPGRRVCRGEAFVTAGRAEVQHGL